MAKGKTVAKKKAPAPKSEVEKEKLGGTVSTDASPAAEVKDAKASKDGSSIVATGKCEVVQFAEGKFRLFNELGVAVSPVVDKDEVLESGKKALSKLQRDCARMNALIKSREVRTPAGHKEVA